MGTGDPHLSMKNYPSTIPVLVSINMTLWPHVSSTSSEHFSLSLQVDRDAVPDLTTYYHKVVHRVSLTLRVNRDPSEPWNNAFEKEVWEKHITEVYKTDYDWVPWSFTRTRSRVLTGKLGVSVIPVQKQTKLDNPFLFVCQIVMTFVLCRPRNAISSPNLRNHP